MSANVPELRFSGFADPWEQRKLVDIALRQTVVSDDPALPTVEYEDINPGEGTLNKNLSTKATHKSGVLFNAGDILYGKLRPYLHNWLHPQFKGIAVGDFWVLEPQRIDGRFVYCLIQSGRFSTLADVSAGSKMPRADWKLISESKFSIPTNVFEQRAVGALFFRLDSLIALHQRKHNQLSVLKGSLLEGMFPKPGSDVPELRFSGFADPWEQRKLGELFVESDDRSSELEILSVSVRGGIYPASESDRTTNPGASIANYKVVHPGDIVYNSMRMWQGAVDSSIYRGIVSPAYVVARPMGGVDSRFFARLLKRPEMLSHYQRVSQGNSKDTLALKFEQFSQIDVSMPLFPREQMAIGELFDGLDSLIALHQRKLEKLRALKQSLLQKMFV
mgnify:CR=1 FL=1